MCDNSTEEDKAALNCHFHVMQNFSKNASFANDFVNKSNCDDLKGGLALKHVRLMHHCKTKEQCATVLCLVLQHWRDKWGEDEAAAKI